MIANQKGFTLLELLVVLVIVGLAASFSGPQLWSVYEKSQERSVVQSFADELQVLRSATFHAGKSIEFLSVNRSSDRSKVSNLPDLPKGWVLEDSSTIYFLPSGVTNGGTFNIRSSEAHLWRLILQPLDGRIEIQRL